MAPKATHMPMVWRLGDRSYKASLGAPVFCKPFVGRFHSDNNSSDGSTIALGVGSGILYAVCPGL